jgi:hypothetical protein
MVVTEAFYAPHLSELPVFVQRGLRRFAFDAEGKRRDLSMMRRLWIDHNPGIPICPSLYAQLQEANGE